MPRRADLKQLGVVLAALLLSSAHAYVVESDVAQQEEADLGECHEDCNQDFIGDRNCDIECFNAECKWDGGDCDAKVTLNRVITMGKFHDHVDYVTYELIGPDGKSLKTLSMEEGRLWDGSAEALRDIEHDWRKSLDMDEDEADSMLPSVDQRTYQYKPWQDAGVDVPI